MSVVSDIFKCLATGKRSAQWLRLKLIPDSAFATIPEALRMKQDRGQVMLYAQYDGDRHPLAIKLDLRTAGRLGRRLCAIAGSEPKPRRRARVRKSG